MSDSNWTFCDGPLAAIIIMVLLIAIMTDGDHDLIDAMICNLMDTCAQWEDVTHE